MAMPYQVILKFGKQSETKHYPTVNEARISADKLAAIYAPKFGQATATVFGESGDEIYVRVSNAKPQHTHVGPFTS
jgi:hypothetical protein